MMVLREKVELVDHLETVAIPAVLIWGVEFGDRVEEWREEVERGSCSLMCTFGLVCGDCSEVQSGTRSVERSRGASKAMD